MRTCSLPRVLLLAVGAIILLTAMKTSHFGGIFESNETDSVDETVFDERFDVMPGEKLVVHIEHADVDIERSSGSQAHVRITLDGRSVERARSFYEHLNFQVEKSGNTLSIRTDARSNWNWNRGGADINVFISVPEVFDADLDVAHGDVSVESLKGRTNVHLAHGDLDVGSLGGTTFDLDVAHGDVEFSALMSEKIRMRIQHGDLDIDRVSAADIEVATAHGDIEIDELAAVPHFSTQHGDIDVHLVGRRGGEFRTSHGDVHITTDRDTGLDVDFDASDIDVASAYRFEGTQRDGVFRGQINGGGPKLSVRSSHGDLSLRSR